MTDNLPELDKSEVEKIVESFKDIYQPASNLISARVHKASNQISIIVSEWSQRNLERGKPIKIIRYTLSDSDFKSCIDINEIDVSHWILNASSKSGKFRAVICDALDSKSNGKNKTYLEIWSKERSIATFDLTALDLHGAVYTDYPFCSISWSAQEDKVIYIAEQKKPKTSPFYEQKSITNSSNGSANNVRGEQFVYEEDWGECISSKYQSVIVCCDIVEKTITVLEGVPKDISPAQTIYVPDGKGIVGVGFMNSPRRLGLIYCTNRKNHIFYLSNQGKYMILSDEQFSVNSPKFSHDGKYLVWFQRQRSGSTQAALSLIRCDWRTKEIISVINTIHDEISTENGKAFFGIYARLSLNGSYVFSCWTSDSKYLLFSTDQKYRTSTYAVNIENGKIWDIGYEKENESTILLNVSEDDYALVNITSFKRSSTLVSLHIPSLTGGHSNESLFSFLIPAVTVSDKNIISNFTVRSDSREDGDCFATYYGPQNDRLKATPLIMYLHGGPHVTVANAFTPEFNFFIKSGFGVLVVFFHGTPGFGQKYLNSLCGNMGSLDVEDCYNTLQAALKKFPWLDPSQVVLFGGSTGGFLIPHLSSRYPNEIKGSAMRNPVTDVYLRCFLTDIPDWAAVQLGYPYNGFADILTNPDLCNKMIDISPMMNIKSVRAPMLFLLGKNDVRVPPQIGLSYYHILKEMNVPTKVLLYEDGHKLSKVTTEMDSRINSVIWFKRCLKRNSKEAE
ncbi:acylamino-acid-releasing enzyme-like [Planococcus citri]|uniref:acylamino-acid-releasing enzyme-like n=1 Tax=Planococcus citri TaxID=170843 RepID=UPI0031F800BC